MPRAISWGLESPSRWAGVFRGSVCCQRPAIVARRCTQCACLVTGCTNAIVTTGLHESHDSLSGSSRSACVVIMAIVADRRCDRVWSLGRSLVVVVALGLDHRDDLWLSSR